MTTTQTQAATPESIKASIKTAAMLLIDGLPYRYGEFFTDLQAQMAPLERGQMFFDVRLAVQELIDEGKLIVLDFKTPQREGRLIAPSGFTLTLCPVEPDAGIEALKALDAVNWLDEDPADCDGLSVAKAQARGVLKKPFCVIKADSSVCPT